jgi:predicted nicotinamide N-methyase
MTGRHSKAWYRHNSPVNPFVADHTRLAEVPFVPELQAYQADEPIALWEHTERDRGTQQPPPFWAFAWAGGQAVARYVLDHPGLVRGKRVLDVAAGSGLIAIAAAKAGATSVRAVEIDPLAVDAIGLNATVNGVTVEAALDDVLAGDGGDTDIVFAGDVFYSREMAGQMLAFMQRVTARGATAVVGDPGRAYLPRADLTRVAEYDVPVVESLEDAPVKRTTVWRVSPGRREL